MISTIENKYYSQYDQDKIIDVLFKHKTGGYFVDVGAHDGVTYSTASFLKNL